MWFFFLFVNKGEGEDKLTLGVCLQCLALVFPVFIYSVSSYLVLPMHHSPSSK